MTVLAGKRLLVTGGSGFVGSHLVRRLVALGCDVHLIVSPRPERPLIADLLPHLTLHVHDGTTDGTARIVKTARADLVFHLASLFLAQHTPDDLEPLVRSNVLFGTQLLEALSAHGPHRLVNTGTSWQHFDNRDVDPVNLYAATKQAFEDILRYYTEATPLRAVSLKLFDTYGPGDPRPKLFTLLRRVAAAGEPLDMSPGEQLIDLVYIDDVVDAFINAGELLLVGGISVHESYAVSSGEPIPLRELVEIYGRVIGRSLPIRWGGRPYREREVMIPWNSGKTLPGWTPRTGLDEGIRLMEGITDTAEHATGKGYA